MIQKDKTYELSQKTIDKFYRLKSEDKMNQRKLADLINVSPPIISKMLKRRSAIKENSAMYVHAMRLGTKLGIKSKEILIEIGER